MKRGRVTILRTAERFREGRARDVAGHPHRQIHQLQQIFRHLRPQIRITPGGGRHDEMNQGARALAVFIALHDDLRDAAGVAQRVGHGDNIDEATQPAILRQKFGAVRRGVALARALKGREGEGASREGDGGGEEGRVGVPAEVAATCRGDPGGRRTVPRRRRRRGGRSWCADRRRAGNGITQKIENF